jgi:hypothetical protein
MDGNICNTIVLFTQVTSRPMKCTSFIMREFWQQKSFTSKWYFPWGRPVPISWNYFLRSFYSLGWEKRPWQYPYWLSKQQPIKLDYFYFKPFIFYFILWFIYKICQLLRLCHIRDRLMNNEMEKVCKQSQP